MHNNNLDRILTDCCNKVIHTFLSFYTSKKRQVNEVINPFSNGIALLVGYRSPITNTLFYICYLYKTPVKVPILSVNWVYQLPG